MFCDGHRRGPRPIDGNRRGPGLLCGIGRRAGSTVTEKMTAPVSAPKSPVSLDDEEARALTVSLQKAARRPARSPRRSGLGARHPASRARGPKHLRRPVYATHVRDWHSLAQSHRPLQAQSALGVGRFGRPKRIPRLLQPGPKTPETDVSSRQALTVLERVFTALPERERLAVALCDVEGIEREEVCNTLGVSATHSASAVASSPPHATKGPRRCSRVATS